MQKMLKTGFRGERKRILTPSLSQGEGECSDGESEGNVVKFSRWLPLKGECGDGEAKETSPFTHTQLSLATSKGGM